MGNSSFATGMRLAGMRDSFVVETKERAKELLDKIPEEELVVANTSVVQLLPALEERENLVTIPDEPEAFGSVSDLKNIVKSAIGFELKLE
jgi:vacuolar-type H+-ATPase subunit F/Vma7